MHLQECQNPKAAHKKSVMQIISVCFDRMLEVCNIVSGPKEWLRKALWVCGLKIRCVSEILT